jgi:multiple sugar transport system substrate-binding protein
MGGNMRKALRMMLGAAAVATGILGLGMVPAQAEWDIAKAAAPFKGEQLNVIFLDRPGYRAII